MWAMPQIDSANRTNEDEQKEPLQVFKEGSPEKNQRNVLPAYTD